MKPVYHNSDPLLSVEPWDPNQSLLSLILDVIPTSLMAWLYQASEWLFRERVVIRGPE